MTKMTWKDDRIIRQDETRIEITMTPTHTLQEVTNLEKRQLLTRHEELAQKHLVGENAKGAAISETNLAVHQIKLS